MAARSCSPIPICEQVGGGFVADLVQQREDAAGGAHHGFLALDQLPDHLLGFRNAFLLLDGRQAGVGGVGAGRREAQGPDALGDVVHGNGQFEGCATSRRSFHAPAYVG